MWQTTSEPLFIFPLLSFLSASPSFSFVMQPEKAVSSAIEKGSKKETDERGEKKRWKDGDGVGMIVCEQVLMTSLLLTPLCLLSSQQPAAKYGKYTTANLSYKESYTLPNTR